MKQYYAMTLPHQVLPKRTWEMFVIFKDDVTGEYSSEKKVAETLQQMNEIRFKMLEMGVQNMH